MIYDTAAVRPAVLARAADAARALAKHYPSEAMAVAAARLKGDFRKNKLLPPSVAAKMFADLARLGPAAGLFGDADPADPAA